MCGIAGIMKYGSDKPAPWAAPRLDFTVLSEMSAAIAHRGPDGEGLWTDPRPNRTVALLHRRLAIVDLPGGHQPMANEDGRVQVVFNGEIYNHLELRKELSDRGHRFATDHSDTEVLVHGWEEWGTGLAQRLRGMFAFGIWDMREEGESGGGTLFLARDRVGQKPLFYATLDDGVVFASTLPAVLAWPEVPRRVPRETLGVYLRFGYVPPPATIYRDVSQVMPGHYLLVRGSVMRGERYWGPVAKSVQGDATEALRGELGRAVGSQLMADVPVACFLSGGIDSSIVAALMQERARAGGASGGTITTVSVGFAEDEFDETRYAEAVAKRIGSRHIRLKVSARLNVADTLEHLMREVLGQPYGDSSILPTHQLAKAVRAVAPVALSGDGGDELFGGYDRYRAMMLLPRWQWALRMMPRRLPAGPSSKRERWRRLAHAARAATAEERYLRLSEITPVPLVEEMVGREWPEMPFLQGPWDASSSPLRLAMRRDLEAYLPGDVLWKVDAAAMAVALEVRSPFLDQDVVAFAEGLRDDDLVRAARAGWGGWRQGGRGKEVLRRAFAEVLPPEVVSRKKQGFGVPIGHWFRSDPGLRSYVRDMLTGPGAMTPTMLQRQVVERLLKEHESGARDHTHRVFALLAMELWARHFHPSLEG